MEPKSAALIEPPPPRLSIFHLLCWTAGTAILLNCYRAYPQASDPARLVLGQLYIVVSSIANGLALASLILFVQHAFRRPCVFPRHPGHWFLIGAGLQSVFAWPAFFLAQHWLTLDPPGGGMPVELRMQLVASVVGNFVGFVVSILALLSVTEPRWRTAWIGCLLLSLLKVYLGSAMYLADELAAYSIYRFWMIGYSVLSALYVAVLLALMLRDRRTPRDWLHYAGAGVAVMLFASHPLFYLFNALFVRP